MAKNTTNQDEVVQQNNEQEKIQDSIPAVEAKTATKFTLAQLRTRSRKLFGVSLSTFDGATSALDPTVTFTVAEMTGHIKKWGAISVNPVKKEDK